MPQTYLKKLQEDGQTVNPVFNFLGIVIEQISKEKVILRLPFKPGFIQGGGVIAGGIMATLADEAMAHLVIANLGAKDWVNGIVMQALKYTGQKVSINSLK